MGFFTGFTGGVTLTLSLAYLSIAAHQRNREEQSRALRAQAQALQAIFSPTLEPLPPSRSEAAAAQRAAYIEVAKDRWNREVEGTVRWMQNTDWTTVRERLEFRVAALWTKASGRLAEEADKSATVKNVKSAAEESRDDISAAAQGAFGRVKETRQRVGAAAEAKTAEIKDASRDIVAKAENEATEKVAEAQGVIASALGKGRDKAHEMVGTVKTAVGLAEGTVAKSATATPAGGKATSPVTKALQQRYGSSTSSVDRPVAEVLKERYIPIDRRDNTILRGL